MKCLWLTFFFFFFFNWINYRKLSLSVESWWCDVSVSQRVEFGCPACLLTVARSPARNFEHHWPTYDRIGQSTFGLYLRSQVSRKGNSVRDANRDRSRFFTPKRVQTSFLNNGAGSYKVWSASGGWRFWRPCDCKESSRIRRQSSCGRRSPLGWNMRE